MTTGARAARRRNASQGLGLAPAVHFALAFIFLSNAMVRADDREWPVKPFAITERSGEIGFEADYLSETQKVDGGDSLEFSNRSLQEYLLYRLNGYVYHPRLVDFRTRFKIGLLQQSIDRTGGSFEGDDNFDSDTFIHGYDIYLNFLKEHPLSLMVYGHKDRSAVLQLFSDRQLIDSERWGAVLNYKRGPLPMDLSVSRSKIREYGADSYSESTYSIVEYAVRNEIGRRVYTELRYRYQDYEQDFSADNRYIDIERTTELKTHDISLLNTIYLNDERTSYLTSTLRYLDQNGTQRLKSTQWQERLNLRHTPKFSTYYLAALLQNKYEEQSVETWRAESGLDYQLYESLRLHLDAHGRWVDFDGSSEDEVGATGRMQYRKQTPWGVLSAGYGRTIDRITRGGSATTRQLIDEEVALRSGVLTFLAQPAVIAGSILVTALDGTTILDEGFDYQIEVRGNRTGLRRLSDARVGEGETVLVDYQIATETDLEYFSDSQDAFLRYDWERFVEGLSTYARWQDLSPRDLPEGENFTVLSFTDWLAGFSWRLGPVTWTEEYEQYRSNFSEYDQISSRLEGYHPIGERMRLGWFAGVLMIDYLDDFTEDDETRVLNGGLTLDGRLPRNGHWNVRAEARKETGLVEETLLGIAGRLGWQLRRVKVEAGGRFEQRERFDSTRDRMNLFLQVSREFGRRQVAE
jgi:hypothetical protein